MKFTYSKDVFSPKWIGLETTGVLGSTQFKQAQQMSNEHLHKSTSTDIGAQSHKGAIHLIGNFDNGDWNIRNGVCMEGDNFMLKLKPT